MATSLQLLNPLPDLKAENENLLRVLQRLTLELQQVKEELQQERSKNSLVERGVTELRATLTPLYQGLARIFGEFESMDISSAPSALDPRKAAVWEDWKRKMPGIPARFIDALLMHGELTQTQLRLHAKCAQGSVAGVVSQLWKAGLINKNGGRISLKEL